ncbi:Nif3-like dinuclear metal center hexameric protein [Candidatus Woesearchaeota archaeon]|nr:Nif3-like dinuclear metal center hexameric protein [Candidatus Woesearchaeota archaeon]
MVPRDKIINYLDEFLEISKFEDKILNGLQIIGKQEVNKIVVGVSPSLELFQKAVEKKADMIILHHGLIADFNPKVIDNIAKQRLKILFDNDITLLAYHLPLDAHYDSGNNAQLLKKLALDVRERFAKFDLGYIGEFKSEKDINQLLHEINSILSTEALLLKHGRDNIKTVAIVSGAGGYEFQSIIGKADVFITGEPKEHMDALAKESKINLIFAGHYNTEKLGVMALADLLKEKFDIDTEFIDVPCKL